MRALLVVASLAAVGGAAWLLYRRGAGAAPAADPAPGSSLESWLPPLPYPDDGGAGVFSGLLFELEDLVTDWQKRAEPYAAELNATAARYGVPGNILLRVGYQESRYRAEVINGTKRSSAGAIGMFQLMPATAKDLGVNPADWHQAADGAARYLAQLYRRFNSWTLALMAYNWGMGNVDKYLAGKKQPPAETRNYVAQIGADVSLA